LLNLYQTALEGSSKKVADVVAKASPDQIKALSELCFNLLREKYPIKSKGYIKRLEPFKEIIRKLGKRQGATNTKKRLLLQQNVQTGGLAFLPALLSPILGTLLASALNQ
jgi:hypothetical protein